MGYKLVKEKDFGWENEQMFIDHIKKGRVLHAPGLFHLAPHFKSNVIFVYRPLEEIYASQNRCYSPGGHDIDFSKAEAMQRDFLLPYGEFFCTTAQRKQELAKEWGLKTVNYHDYEDHPLWVSTKIRREEGNKWHVERTMR